MANLTIRNLDDEVVNILKRRAKRNNRSLEAELREVLARVAEGATPASLRIEAARIAAMTTDVPQTDSAKLIREDRDR